MLLSGARTTRSCITAKLHFWESLKDLAPCGLLNRPFLNFLVVALLIADWVYLFFFFLKAAIVVVDSTSNVSLFFSSLLILQHQYLFHITEP